MQIKMQNFDRFCYFDIASVSITEAFSPLIGLNMTMKNSLMLKFEYRKQRNLTMKND